MKGMPARSAAVDQALSPAADATFRTILEALPAAVLAVDGSGRIALLNAAAARMFGYAQHELVGTRIESLIPERFRQSHVGHVPRFFRKPGMRPMGAGIDLFALRKDGSEFPVDIGLSYLETYHGLLGISFVTDISERKNNQREVQALMARLLGIQEGDNKELSRELHDGLSQKLAALGMEVSTLFKGRVEADDAFRERVRALSQTINALAGDVHAISRRLHPAILSELGLEAAIREECLGFSADQGASIQFVAENIPPSIPEDVSLCLYRVAQESLRNIAKHAGVANVRVQLSGSNKGITLRVEDTGEGFHLKQVRSKGGLGLISMEERARLVNGRYSLVSRPGKGTTVELFVPSERGEGGTGRK